jgi:hypothetical protein
MSYSELVNIKNFKNKNILFLDTETIGLPIQKGDINTKPEDKYYNFTQNDKYDTSRLIQLSYYYYENYDNNIPNKKSIQNFIVKPSNFKVNGTEFHGITDRIANNSGIIISNVLSELSLLLIFNKIDYIVGYNVFFDIYIILNELNRINGKEAISKLLEFIQNNHIIDIAQICIKIDISVEQAKNRKIFQANNNKYRIFKQSYIYEQLFNETQLNTHNSIYDVLNLIKICTKLFLY